MAMGMQKHAPNVARTWSAVDTRGAHPRPRSSERITVVANWPEPWSS